MEFHPQLAYFVGIWSSHTHQPHSVSIYVELYVATFLCSRRAGGNTATSRAGSGAGMMRMYTEDTPGIKV